MSRLLLIVVTWYLASTNCLAGEREKAIVAATFPKTSIVDMSVGPIDGKTHIAALVFDESRSAIAVAVFADDGGDIFKLRTKSGWMTRHPRWYKTSIKIERGSVYFSLSGNGGAGSDYSSQHQFKPQNDQFLLVGTESTDIGVEPRQDGTEQAVESQLVSYARGTSVNYLTGEILHWRVQAPSTAEPFKDDILRIKTGKKRVERHFRFTPTKIVRLEDFDIWAEPDNPGQHIGGYFDQHFKYHE